MHAAELEYLNPEHESIFNETKHIPGWQEPGDSFKLFEMAYRSGDVILEIGTYGGRSAAVELKGALSNPERKHPPQFFGIEIDIHGVWRSYNSLKEEGLEHYAMLFHGDLASFINVFSVKPTMVFVDGDHRYAGVKRDLAILADILSPGTPVLCHDYKNPENDTGVLGVRQAVNEFIEDGYATLDGTFGCSAYLVTTDKCQGTSKDSFTTSEFLQNKARILESQGHQLYQNWQNSEGDRKLRLDIIHNLQNQIPNEPSTLEESSSSILVLKDKLQNKQKKLKKLREEVKTLSAELEVAYAENQAMRSSKFWKMRSLWFRLKRYFGLTESRV